MTALLPRTSPPSRTPPRRSSASGASGRRTSAASSRSPRSSPATGSSPSPAPAGGSCSTRGTSRRRRSPWPCAAASPSSGPTFIKLGQLIASSPGLFPGFLADELRRLLDDVPPEPARRIRRTIERELGQPVDELFALVRRPAAGGGVGRAGAPGPPARRHRGGGEGPPAAPPASGSTATSACCAWSAGAVSRMGALGEAAQPRGDRRRPRQLDARGARLPPRGAPHGGVRRQPRRLRDATTASSSPSRSTAWWGSGCW